MIRKRAPKQTQKELSGNELGQFFSKITLINVLFLLSFINTCLEATSAENIRLEEAVSRSSPQFTPPSRALPAETILLENGSTTFVSSLEDFLDVASALPRANDTSRNQSETSQSTNSPSSGVDENETKAKHGHANSSKFSVPEKSAQLFQIERLNEASSFIYDQISTKSTTASPIKRLNSTTIKAQKQHLQLEQQENSGHSNSSVNHGSGANQHHGNQHHTDKSSSSSSTVVKQHWQVKSLLNVTQDYPLASSRIICGYVWPLMAAITMFTNLMIVFVLTQRDMRTPTNVVLTAIAIADIVPIVVPVPWFVYLFAMGNEKLVLYPPIACYFYQHLTRSVSEIFYFLSTWLNVLLAIQDYLTACKPKLAKKYCQIKVVICEIISLTLLAFLINLPQALKLVFKPVKFYYNGQITWGCKAAQARWFKDLIGEYAALYDDIFTAIIVVFVDGGPAIALITLTALLIRQLQRQRIQGHLLMEQARTASKRRRERHRQQEYESSARVMIFVLVAFLAVKIPFATTYTLMIIQSRFEIHFVENLNDFQKAITLTDLVFVLSYPLNFTIFCCCSKKFRHKCVQLLGECNRNTNAAKARWMSRISDSFHGSIGSESDSSHIYSIQQNRQSITANSKPQLATDMNGAATTNTVELLNSIKNKLAFDSPYMHISNNNNNNNNNLGYDHNGNIYNQLQMTQQHQQRHENDNELTTTTTTIICDEGNANTTSTTNLAPTTYKDRGLELDSEMKAMLDDGSICIECIARYEKMKREHLECRERRLSSDSLGINSCPPPPPPLISCPYQVPHIVTTRCESIRESSNGDSDNGGESGTKSTECLNQHIKKQHKQQDRTKTEGGRVEKEEDQGGINREEQQRLFNSYIGTWLSSPMYKQEQDNHLNLEHPSNSRRGNGSISSPRVSSDPGAEFINQSKELMMRRSDVGLEPTSSSSKPRKSFDKQHGGNRHANRDKHYQDELTSEEDDDSERQPCSNRVGYKNNGSSYGKELSLIKMNHKHRSLSMSNSKLSALPSATGLLADILKTTLLTSSQTSIGQASNSGANSNTNSIKGEKRAQGKGKSKGKGGNLVRSAPAR